MIRRDIKVGDKVTWFAGGWSKQLAIYQVVRVAKNYITLDDGSKWTFRGSRWGFSGSNFYRSPFITDYAPEHEQQLAEVEQSARIDAIASALEKVNWRTFDEATLRSILKSIPVSASGAGEKTNE